MRSNIQLLMMVDASVSASFKLAREHWAGILEDIETVRLSDLAARLANEQRWFEERCGNTRSDGQEVMVWTGLRT
jgi:hypothetical protein